MFWGLGTGVWITNARSREARLWLLVVVGETWGDRNKLGRHVSGRILVDLLQATDSKTLNPWRHGWTESLVPLVQLRSNLGVVLLDTIPIGKASLQALYFTPFGLRAVRSPINRTISSSFHMS